MHILTIYVSVSLSLLHHCNAFLWMGPLKPYLSDRIINGNQVMGNEFPWKVAIKGQSTVKRWDFLKLFPRVTYCGASIINDRWIITAAHCFDGKDEKSAKTIRNPKNWHARIGSVKLEPNMKDRMYSYMNRLWNKMTADNRGQVYYHVEKIAIHPSYQINVLEHDIALMKLKEPLPLRRLSAEAIPLPINISSMDWPPVEDVCTIVGWGCSGVNGEMMRVAQHVTLKVLAAKQCRDIYMGDINLTDTREFCAGYHNQGIGICPGDSGSSLVCKKNGRWVMAGITSATHGLSPERYPGLFTRVSSYMDWISSVLQND